MKKKIIISTVAVTLFSTLAFPLSSVLANDLEGDKESQISIPEEKIINELENLDPYVKVEDNTYILELPKDIIVNPILEQEARTLIDKSNKIISEEQVTIDPTTKTATIYESAIQPLAYKEGVNSVTLHWSHAKINLSKSTATAVQAGNLAALNFLTPYLPSVSLQLFASVLIATIGSQTPKGGVWVHYNYLSLVGIHTFTEWGYQ